MTKKTTYNNRERLSVLESKVDALTEKIDLGFKELKESMKETKKEFVTAREYRQVVKNLKDHIKYLKKLVYWALGAAGTLAVIVFDYLLQGGLLL